MIDGPLLRTQHEVRGVDAARIVEECDARSGLFVRVPIHADMLAALTLYAREPRAFDPHAVDRVRQLAQEVGAMVDAAIGEQGSA